MLFKDRKIFFRYIANGSGLAILYFALTQILGFYIQSKLVTSQLAFFPTMALAFWIHRKSSFQSDNELFAEFFRFAVAQFVSFFLISISLIVFLETLSVSDQLTYLAIILAKAGYNAVAYSLYVFKPKN